MKCQLNKHMPWQMWKIYTYKSIATAFAGLSVCDDNSFLDFSKLVKEFS